MLYFLPKVACWRLGLSPASDSVVGKITVDLAVYKPWLDKTTTAMSSSEEHSH
jgi:hypothetical protein